MNKALRFLVLLPYVCVCGALWFCSCVQRVSGTEVGNPATVSGRVRDIGNNAVADAVVFLVSPDYNPVLDTIDQIESIGNGFESYGVTAVAGDSQRVSTRTDDKGEFVLDGVAPAAYNLFIADSGARRISFRPRIAVNGSLVDLGSCEVRSVGYATILVPDSVFEPNSFISLPGTPIKKAIDSAGHYTVPIVDDSITINYYGHSGDSLSAIIRNQPVPAVNAGDTIDFTGIETVIIPPVVVAILGNDTLYSPINSIGRYDTLIHIAALGATINKTGLLEYQFYEATQKMLSAWSTDNSYLLELGDSMEYSVACRVRSSSNTANVTAWTPGLLIRTRRSPDSAVIPVPSVPVPLDTFGFADSLSYRFLIRDSADTAAFSLSYRLDWSDTAGHNGLLPWARDSICVIRFPAAGMYKIRAQARSVADTSQMSLWSDSLLFAVKP